MITHCIPDYKGVFENQVSYFSRGAEKQSGSPLVIPNAEVRSIFSDFILKLFEKEVAEDGEAADAFCRALKNGEAEEAEQLFMKFMDKTISIRDYDMTAVEQTCSARGMSVRPGYGLLCVRLGLFGISQDSICRPRKPAAVCTSFSWAPPDFSRLSALHRITAPTASPSLIMVLIACV